MCTICAIQEAITTSNLIGQVLETYITPKNKDTPSDSCPVSDGLNPLGLLRCSFIRPLHTNDLHNKKLQTVSFFLNIHIKIKHQETLLPVFNSPDFTVSYLCFKDYLTLKKF